MPKICVLGLGYIGLPTSVIFARYGFQVVGVDINPVIVEKINCGETHIIEPNLNSQLKVVLKNKSFIARTSPVEADILLLLFLLLILLASMEFLIPLHQWYLKQ